jgi:hypothetical protein
MNKEQLDRLKKASKSIVRRILLPVFVIHTSLGGIAAIRNASVTNDEYGAILLSDDAITEKDYWASPLACFGAYPYWTYYFNNRHMKAKWFLRAKSTDLAKVVKDKKCQSIVLVGHGNLNAWLAADRQVTNTDVERMMKGESKKEGEWLQLTCGEEDIFPIKMGELVMEKERVYTYRGPINCYILVTDALFGFRYLKSINNKPSTHS